MGNVIKKIKIKKEDGTFTDYIPIGAEAENVNVDGESVQVKLNKTPYYYNTVADMKADKNLKNGDMIILKDGNYHYLSYSVGTDAAGNKSIFLDNGLYANLLTLQNEASTKMPKIGVCVDVSTVSGTDRFIRQAKIVQWDDIHAIMSITGINQYKQSFTFTKRVINELAESDMIIDTVRFYIGSSTLDTIGYNGYKTSIINALNQFNDVSIKNIWIFNERYSWVREHLVETKDLIDYLHSHNYKVGMSFGGGGAMYLKKETNNVIESLDFIGYNYYPCINCTQHQKTTEQDVKDQLNKWLDGKTEPFNENQESYISEIGIKPYWEFLVNPAQYDNSLFPTLTYSVDVQKIYYGAVFKTLWGNKIKNIYFWYWETFTDDLCYYFKSLKDGRK